MTVDLGGYYSDDYDEGIHVGDDMAVSDVALQSLKDEHAGEVDQAASTSASSAVNLDVALGIADLPADGVLVIVMGSAQTFETVDIGLQPGLRIRRSSPLATALAMAI